MKRLLLITLLYSANLFAQNKVDGYIIHEETRSAELANTKYYIQYDTVNYSSILYIFNSVPGNDSGYIVYKTIWKETDKGIDTISKEYYRIVLNGREVRSGKGIFISRMYETVQ